jgi:phenylalanyl-tRNA synthetase beta subunit
MERIYDICENKKSIVQSEKEIIEEVGRIYGFNNLMDKKSPKEFSTMFV